MIRPVQGLGELLKVTVYPNPSIDGAVNVVFDNTERRTIVLSDISGRAVKNWNGFSENNLRITNLQPGTYMLRVVSEVGGDVQHQKIIINR